MSNRPTKPTYLFLSFVGIVIIFAGIMIFSFSEGYDAGIEDARYFNFIEEKFLEYNMCFPRQQGDLLNGVFTYCRWKDADCYEGFLEWSGGKGLYWNNSKAGGCYKFVESGLNTTGSLQRYC